MASNLSCRVNIFLKLATYACCRFMQRAESYVAHLETILQPYNFISNICAVSTGSSFKTGAHKEKPMTLSAIKSGQISSHFQSL
jgi:hypothetical protein